MEVLLREISVGEVAMFKMPIGLYEKALPDELSYDVFYETSDDDPFLLSPLPEDL